MKSYDIKRDFQNLLDFFPEAILSIDLDYKIINVNKLVEELTGYKKDELIGKDCMFFVNDPCGYRCCICENGEKLMVKNICKIKTKSGTEKMISKKADYLYIDGVKAGYIETLADMTSTENLYDELILYLTVIEQSANVIVITDPSGNILFVNEAFELTTGYIKTESIGSNPRILKTDFHDKDFYKDLWDTISSGMIWKGIFKNKRKDGSFYWEKATITPIKGRNDSIIYYMAVKEDITESVIKEERIDRLLKEYESIFNNNLYGLVLTGDSGKILKINDRFEEMTGFSKDEILEKFFNEFGFDLMQFNVTAFGASEKENIRTFEHEFKNKSGENIWFSITGKAVDNAGIRNGFLWSFCDITKEKMLEDFKKNINQIMHHDLRSPISSIIGIADQVLYKYITPEEYESHYYLIKEIGMNMIGQMNMFLAISKIEDGNYKYMPLKTDIMSIIRNTVRMLDSIGNYSNSRKITVELNYNGAYAGENSSLFIYTDENLITSIMTNLIKNAIEASPDGKSITISIVDSGDFIISVHNFGAIPLEIRNNFFMKFYTSGKSGGTGLGAYSVKLMSETLGAGVSFETDEDKGTTISINFGNAEKLTGHDAAAILS